jgi:hypothetical protein
LVVEQGAARIPWFHVCGDAHHLTWYAEWRRGVVVRCETVLP